MTEIFFGIVFILIMAFFVYNSQLSKQKKDNCFAIFAFTYLFIFAGFRHVDIANDTISYVISFLSIDSNQSFGQLYDIRLEPAYQYLNKFIYIYINHNPLSLLIITSFAIQFLNVRFMYKHSSMLWLSIFLFVTLRYYFFSVSGIRQAIAVGLCFWGYTYLLKKQNIKFILLVLIAALFHYSALIVLPLLAFKRLKFNKKNAFIFGIGSLIIFVFFSYIFTKVATFATYGSDYYQYYNDPEISSLGTIIITLVMLMSFIFVLLTGYLKKTKYSETAKMELWCIFLSILIGFVSIKFTILGRFTYYFAIFSVIIIPNAISVLNRNNKYLSIFFWIIFSLIYIMTILYLRPEWYHFYPYKFYWQ